MKQNLKIDIVSDVSCPWCIIGYQSLKAALLEMDIQDSTSLNWRPFELNPHMPPEGQDLREHMQQKYGATAAQSAANRLNIKARGAAVGYAFDIAENGRIYNTFNAHRLLHWAKDFDLQTELKLALFDLYFKYQGNPGSEQDLVACAEKVGLNAAVAKKILDSDAFVDEVKAELAMAHQQQINSVPTFIFNNKYLVTGGQAKEVFIKVLKELQNT